MDGRKLRVGDKIPGLYPSTYTPDDIKEDKAKLHWTRLGSVPPVMNRVEWIHPEGRFVTVRFIFDGGSFCESFLLGRGTP